MESGPEQEEQVRMPESVEEAEALILSLYQPGLTPARIVRIQETIQKVQKSPGGWVLAKSLLDRPFKTEADDKIKFFGALTIIVKLNNDSSALSEEHARELVRDMLGWLMSASNQGSSPMTMKKISQALATYFIYFPQFWPCCVRHFFLCLSTGQALPIQDAQNDDGPDTLKIVASLSFEKLRVGLWFVTTLVDEVTKLDMTNVKYAATHQTLLQNTTDVAAVLRVALLAEEIEVDTASGLNFSNPAIQQEAVTSFQAWTLYAQRARNSDLVTALRGLVDLALGCLYTEHIWEEVAEYFIDVLTNYQTFLTSAHYELLAAYFETEVAQANYQTLMEGDFEFEYQQFGHLMLAYGDAQVVSLIEQDTERNRKFLEGLSGLVATEGYAVAEDNMFVPALEFWSRFVETLNLYSDEFKVKYVEPLFPLIMQVVGSCWKKIHYPPIQTFMEWDSAERVGFGDARRDVADLLQAVYILAGRTLVSLFVNSLLSSIPNRAWTEIEAAAFALSALSDPISDETSYDDLLGQVFSSAFFDLLSLGESQLPVRLRQTALSLIERYSDYFERHSENLPAALNLLFQAVRSPSLSAASSKSIMSLCSSCRNILTGEVQGFLGYYQTLHADPEVDVLAEERLSMAIASVIQAMPDEDQRLEAFERLLSFVRSDVEICLRYRASGERTSGWDEFISKVVKQATQSSEGIVPTEEDCLVASAVHALRRISSMGKGMQGTSEPVDLDADTTKTLATAPRGRHLTLVQASIIDILARLQASFPASGGVVEAICQVLKVGFSETELGPFVFPLDTITGFFTQQGRDTPRIGVVIGTAHSFVSSLSNGQEPQVVSALTKLLPWIVSLLQGLAAPEEDTELTQNGIEFVLRIMTRNPRVLLQLQPPSSLEFFFYFTLRVLNGNEPLPKQAAAEFWMNFITLKSEEPATQGSINHVMELLGPMLSQSLIQNIGGNASRSELDKLTDPLKKLVVQNVKAQSWLEGALNDPSFPSNKVTPADKAAFLKKIINLRGARQTNQVVRDFWLACRGSNFAYAS